jgi:hypothetical protein
MPPEIGSGGFFMTRIMRFTFLCDQQERSMISTLAENLHRTQSDTIRFLIRSAFQDTRRKGPQCNTNVDTERVSNERYVGS